MVANTSGSRGFSGSVLCDLDINRGGVTFKVAYSNKGTTGTGKTRTAPATIYSPGAAPASTQSASLPIVLAPWEVQILVPQ